MSLDNLKPSQLFTLTLVGGLVAGFGFLAFLPRYPHGSAPFYAQLLLTVSLTVGGLWLSLKSSSAIENGIAADRWSSEATTTLRATLESSLLHVLAAAFLFTSFFLICAFRHHSELAFAALIQSQTIQRLQYLSRPRTNRRPAVDWNSFPPLTSTHWGEK